MTFYNKIIIYSILFINIFLSTSYANPLSLDSNGNIRYRDNSYFVLITRDKKIFINNKFLADCRNNNSLDIEDKFNNSIECDEDGINIELSNENELEYDFEEEEVTADLENGDTFTLNLITKNITKDHSNGVGVNVLGGGLNIKTGPSGVNIDMGNSHIQTGDSGVEVDLGEDYISTKNGVQISTPEIDLITDSEGVDIYTNGHTLVDINDNVINVETNTSSLTVDNSWRGDYLSEQSIETTKEIIKILNVKETKRGLKVNIPNKVLFDFDSYNLRPESKLKLSQLSKLIRTKTKNNIIVIGHTDSKGSDKYNMELSKKRALSVIRYLNTRENIPSSLLLAEGKGEREPIAKNQNTDGSDNPLGRSKNRRVEIFIQ